MHFDSADTTRQDHMRTTVNDWQLQHKALREINTQRSTRRWPFKAGVSEVPFYVADAVD